MDGHLFDLLQNKSILCVLIRIASILRSTHNIHFQNQVRALEFFQNINVCSYGKKFKIQFEITMVNEPSVFEPLKFYCSADLDQTVPEEQSGDVLQYLKRL